MRADLDDVLPLTPLQEGMLFHGLYDQAADVYTEQVSFDLAGELSVATLKQACCSVLERHASLRAGFRVLRSGAIVQESRVRFPRLARSRPSRTRDEASEAGARSKVAGRANKTIRHDSPATHSFPPTPVGQ